MNKYEIVVTFKRPKLKDKVYQESLKFNYNDDTFLECEGLIRDTLNSIANRFINSEYY